MGNSRSLPGAAVPTFLGPETDPPLPEEEIPATGTTATPALPELAEITTRPTRRRFLRAGSDETQAYPGPQSPSIPGQPTRTDTSSPVSKPSQADTAKAIAGVLAIAIAAAAFLASQRHRTLRKPSKEQYDAMARPLARMGLRHASAEVLNADLFDVISFGAAAGDYISDGPLTTRGREVDPGVPADLNGEPQ